MHRLFVGLALPAPLAERALAAADDAPPGWSPQDDEQLHLTVRFLGEVERHVAEDIDDALLTLDAPAIALELDGVGWFDHGPRGALFARATPREPLDALHRKVDRLVTRAGLAPEGRAYFPHVTLARRRSGAAPPNVWLSHWTGLVAGPAIVDKLTLFESRLGRHGASYEAIAEYPLSRR